MALTWVRPPESLSSSSDLASWFSWHKSAKNSDSKILNKSKQCKHMSARLFQRWCWCPLLCKVLDLSGMHPHFLHALPPPPFSLHSFTKAHTDMHHTSKLSKSLHDPNDFTNRQLFSWASLFLVSFARNFSWPAMGRRKKYLPEAGSSLWICNPLPKSTLRRSVSLLKIVKGMTQSHRRSWMILVCFLRHWSEPRCVVFR